MKDPWKTATSSAATSPLVGYGTEGTQADFTLQVTFAPVTVCGKCGGRARMALTIAETNSPGRFVTQANPNDGGIWPHDAAAFAVYICAQCGEATTVWNQG